MAGDFTRASHTIVLSDIHLADAEPPHPKNPLWKRFKRPAHFVDRSFRKFLEHIDAQAPGESKELVLNGDIFDFDSVMKLPKDDDEGEMRISWLERLRGLHAEEEKSRFKIVTILDDHPIWAEAIRNWVTSGNRLVFVIGNHDIELHWPQVRRDLVEHLGIPDELKGRVRFCEWFYVSNGDTLIEHGHQYDAYTLCSNPIHPLIRKGSRVTVRIPFGNMAGRFMTNGMGLMNPHSAESFIKESLWEYLVFFYRYVMRTQPLLLWTWFWGACVTLVFSIGEGLLPALSDPLTVDSRVQEIADRSNSQPRVVWSLRELHAHPAIFNPFKILRELWLDRAFFLGLIFFGSFQFFSFLNVFTNVSVAWFLVPLALLLPIFIFYSRSVSSEVEEMQRRAFEMAPIAARIAGVKRVVQGHTHLEKHTVIPDGAGGVEYLNTGTWSPAYKDVECTQPYGRKCFAWIRPGAEGGARQAELFAWNEDQIEKVPNDRVVTTAAMPALQKKIRAMG